MFICFPDSPQSHPRTPPPVARSARDDDDDVCLKGFARPTARITRLSTAAHRRSARTRKLSERQEEAAASPEKAKALVSEVLGQGVAEALDPAIVAAVLQRTAGATRLANLIEDLGLSSPDRYKALSEEDQAEVRQTLQGIVSLVQDVQGVVEVIQEDPAKAGAQVVAFLKDQGRRGVELLLTAAAGDEQASFKVKRFLRGLQIDLTIGVLTGLSDEVAEAGALESSEGGLLDDLRGMFRKLRKGEGEVDLPEGSGRTGREMFGELPEAGRTGDDVGNALGRGGKGPGGTTDPVLGKPRVGSALKDDLVKPVRNDKGEILKEFPATPKAHGFPDVVDNFAAGATQFQLRSGATLYQIEGTFNGVTGRFEWIVDNGQVTHRMFVAGGTVNGVPITP